jgi:anti-sigma B factor antagonist
MQTASLGHEDVSTADGTPPTYRRVHLGGRLDMVGMEEIALRFTSLTAAKAGRVLVDMSEVSFLASIGIRSIINSARALDAKGGRMVLLVPDNSKVRETLATTGIGEVIPIRADEQEALQTLLA